MGFPDWFSGKESTYQCSVCGFDSWVRKIPRRRKWQPTPVFLPEKSHGWRRLLSYSPWGHKRVGHDWMTKHPHPLTNNACVYRPGLTDNGALRPVRRAERDGLQCPHQSNTGFSLVSWHRKLHFVTHLSVLRDFKIIKEHYSRWQLLLSAVLLVLLLVGCPWISDDDSLLLQV